MKNHNLHPLFFLLILSLSATTVHSSQNTSSGGVGFGTSSTGSQSGQTQSAQDGTTNTTANTLITPGSSSPTNSLPAFTAFYQALNNMQQVLFESLNTYWKFDLKNASSSSISTSATESEQINPLSNCSLSSFPDSANSILKGNMGDLFGGALMPGSLPLQIMQTIRTSILQYVHGMTTQLNATYYNANAGNDFINSIQPANNTNLGTFSGHLASLDTLWEQTVSVMDNTLQKIGGSRKYPENLVAYMANNYQNLESSYLLDRYQTIIHWYYNLVTTISSRYNPALLSEGSFSYTQIPDIAILTGYCNAFIDACNHLKQYCTQTKNPISFYVGSHTLSYDPQNQNENLNTLLTEFFQPLQSEVFTHLGVISSYASALGLKRADDRAAGKIPPNFSPAPIITYNTVQEVATFGVSDQTGSLPTTPFFPGTRIQTNADFQCAQALFSSVNGSLAGALNAFNFPQPPSFIAQKLSPLVLAEYSQTTSTPYDSSVILPVVSYTQQGLNAPQRLLNQLNADMQNNKELLNSITQSAQALKSSQESIISTQYLIGQDITNCSSIIQELIFACTNMLNAGYWFNQAGNQTLCTTYKEQFETLDDIITQWTKAYQGLNSLTSYPSKKNYSSYLTASTLFYETSELCKKLNLHHLSSYTTLLGACLSVEAYQNVMGLYAHTYEKDISFYTSYIQRAPHYSREQPHYPSRDSTWQFDIEPGYEKMIFEVIFYVNEAISAATRGYQNQLSFFLSQQLQEHDTEYFNLIWPLQDALLVFSNFREAITPLLLSTPCAVDQRKSLLCGLDYNLIQTTEIVTDTVPTSAPTRTSGSKKITSQQSDVASLIIQAHKGYIKTYPLFKMLDTILAKYPEESSQYATLQQYTSLASLFQLAQHKLTFSSFFLLHQARLYVSVAQQLIQGKPFFWQAGDPVSPQGSAFALLLYAYASGLYRHLGYTENAAIVDQMKYVMFSQELVKDFHTTINNLLNQHISSLDSNEVNTSFEEANALATVLYLSSRDEKTHKEKFTTDDYLAFLSQTIMNSFSSKRLTLENYGYADWLATNPDGIENAPLQAAVVYYQGYVIATADKHPKAAYFLRKAQNQFAIFMRTADAIIRKNNLSQDASSVQLNGANTQAQLAQIKQLVNMKDAYDAALFQMQFSQFVFTDTFADSVNSLSSPSTLSSTTISFFNGTFNVPGLIGTIYNLLADQSLATVESDVSKSLTEDLSEKFDTIITNYSNAQNFYGIAAMTDTSYQTKFLNVAQTLTNTVAYQNYLNVIPRFNLSLNGVTLPTTSIPELTTEKISFEEGISSSNGMIGTFFYRTLTEQLSAQKFVLPEEDSTDSEQLLSDYATPFYGMTLLSEIQDQTTPDNLKAYVTDYASLFSHLIQNGVTINGQKLQGTISYDTTTKKLTLRNSPLTPLPRFSVEQSSALGYYSTSNLLYGNSTVPHSFEGHLLIPSNNPEGQALIKGALLNCYLSRAVELESKINALKLNPQYIQLQKATTKEKIDFLFTDYLPLLKEFQTLYTQLLGLYNSMISLLANYSADPTVGPKLMTQSMLEYMEVIKNFICGAPTLNNLLNLLNTLVQGSQQIQQYANQVTDGQNTIMKAANILAQGYEYMADAYSQMPTQTSENTLVATAQQTSDPLAPSSLINPPSYPITLPEQFSDTGLKTPFSWKNAGLYYFCAAHSLSTTKSQLQHLSPEQEKQFSTMINNYYVNAAKMFIQYATYCISLFALNAYQECRCTSSITLETSNEEVYPSWDYPVTGQIPGTGTSKTNPIQYYSYPKCLPNPADGNIYNIPMPESVYQGVASMEKPRFTAIKNACINGAPNNYSSMYSSIQQMLLNGLYYYTQASGILKIINPLQGFSQSAQQNRINSINSQKVGWIVDTFTENPAFLNPYVVSSLGNITKLSETQQKELARQNSLPLIQIEASSAATVTIKGKQTRVTQFSPIVLCRDMNLSLANTKQFYLQTTRYWISQPVFFRTITQELLKTCTLQTCDYTASLLQDIISMIKSIAIWTYMPSIGINDAEYEIEQMIQNSQQDNSGESASYF